MRVVIVHLRVKPEQLSAFLVRLRQQAKDSLELETQCRRFDVCLDPQDSCRICLYEIYDDQPAFDAHLKTGHFRAFDDDTRPWVDEKRVEVWNLDTQTVSRDTWLAQ